MEPERKYAYQIIQITNDKSKPLSQIIFEVEEKVREIITYSKTITQDLCKKENGNAHLEQAKESKE